MPTLQLVAGAAISPQPIGFQAADRPGANRPKTQGGRRRRMRFVELMILRTILWIGLPLLLVALAIGPKRLWRNVRQGWQWLWMKRLEPEEILSQVVKQHEELVDGVNRVISQAEAAEAEIQRNIEQGERNVASLDEESRVLATRHDDAAAREALFKLSLEKSAIDNFRQQLERQQQVIAESRRRRFLLELQLRQYEVGRSILLSQLAEAKGVEQQYAIASQFDPFNAVADWQRAENMVQEKSLLAKARERVQSDIAEPGAVRPPAQVDPAVLDAQLAELRSRLESGAGEAERVNPAADPSRRAREIE
jgi:phage shock protein A